jgi:hypothetical protein
LQELVNFLHDQLDEDKRVLAEVEAARVAAGADRLPLTMFGVWWSWDPSRVLAEIEAKQAILRRRNHIAGFPAATAGLAKQSIEAAAAAYNDVVRDLALPYRDRPGYRPEWAPTPVVR